MKTNRNFKKITRIATTALMTACLTVPMSVNFNAMAEGSISISNSATGHTYEAYQIFDGDLANGVLSNIVWGKGVTNTDQLLAEIKGITLTGNTTPFASCTDADDVAKVLADANVLADAEITQKFADVVGKYLGTATGTSTAGEGTYSINGLDEGYYLVKDNNSPDSYTRYIVEVLGSKTNIAPKGDFPTVEKKIQENVKTGDWENAAKYGDRYNDTADFSIGDTVPFKLIGTIPTNIGDYDTYNYVFNDSLDTAFTFDKDSVKVTINDEEITSEYIVSDLTPADGMQKFTISFDDIKKAATLTGGEKVVVTYNATLNSNAEIGKDGQTNTVYLTYSNNPNAGGEGSKGETPTDTVIAFTYELDVTKVDGVNDSTKLQGAEFKLSNSDGSKFATVDENGYLTGWADSSDAGSTLTSDASGIFKVIGLDDGTYKLTETKAPTGYNKLEEDITIVITADTSNAQTDNTIDGNELTALKIKVDNGTEKDGSLDDGKVSMTVKNNAGSTLPSTGGIGTKIFYIGGGSMVAVAGVLLITKKRMKNK